MQQICCCSYFSTSIASVWTVETRCFLSSSNTGRKSNMFVLPVLPEFLAILLPAVWTLRSPLLLKNEQQPISALLFAFGLVLIIIFGIIIRLVPRLDFINLIHAREPG
jgi:hypothetical protein